MTATGSACGPTFLWALMTSTRGNQQREFVGAVFASMFDWVDRTGGVCPVLAGEHCPLIESQKERRYRCYLTLVLLQDRRETGNNPTTFVIFLDQQLI